MADPEKIYAFERFLEELKLYLKTKFQYEGLPIPWPVPKVKHEKTIKIFEEFYNNTENLMAISDKIASHVKLEEDETFCCFLFVTKRPEFLSEVMGPTPEPSVRMLDSGSYNFPFGEITAAACPFICYNKIMEPAIMKAMISKREEDKIDYSSKKS